MWKIAIDFFSLTPCTPVHPHTRSELVTTMEYPTPWTAVTISMATG